MCNILKTKRKYLSRNVIRRKIYFNHFPCTSLYCLCYVTEAQCLICINNICFALHIFILSYVLLIVYSSIIHINVSKNICSLIINAVHNRICLQFISRQNVERIRMQFNIDINALCINTFLRNEIRGKLYNIIYGAKCSSDIYKRVIRDV